MPGDDIVVGWQDDRNVNGAIMRFPPGHPLLAEAIEACLTKSTLGPWDDLGPLLLTQLTEKHGLRERVLEPSALYPVHYSAAWSIRSPAEP